MPELMIGPPPQPLNLWTLKKTNALFMFFSPYLPIGYGGFQNGWLPGVGSSDSYHTKYNGIRGVFS